MEFVRRRAAAASSYALDGEPESGGRTVQARRGLAARFQLLQCAHYLACAGSSTRRSGIATKKAPPKRG